MIRFAMSRTAAALLRALIRRGDVPINRILLTEIHSEDWQSLTLNGERHRISLRILGPDSVVVADRIAGGIDEAEFDLPAAIVADIAVPGAPTVEADGATGLVIEALTILSD